MARYPNLLFEVAVASVLLIAILIKVKLLVSER